MKKRVILALVLVVLRNITHYVTLPLVITIITIIILAKLWPFGMFRRWFNLYLDFSANHHPSPRIIYHIFKSFTKRLGLPQDSKLLTSNNNAIQTSITAGTLCV